LCGSRIQVGMRGSLRTGSPAAREKHGARPPPCRTDVSAGAAGLRVKRDQPRCGLLAGLPGCEVTGRFSSPATVTSTPAAPAYGNFHAPMGLCATAITATIVCQSGRAGAAMTGQYSSVTGSMAASAARPALPASAGDRCQWSWLSLRSPLYPDQASPVSPEKRGQAGAGSGP